MSNLYNKLFSMKKLVLTATFIVCGVCMAAAQLLTVTPSFPRDTTSISIITDCTKGNQGLLNYADVNDVYVHVGVITNLSTSPTDWKYVKFTNFNAPNPAAKAENISANKYRYIITRIRDFFGVPAGETIKKVTFLLRNGAGTVVQRNIDGSDMYIDVYDPALVNTKFVEPFMQPRYVPTPEPITKSVGDNINIFYLSSQTGDLRIYFNGTAVAFAPASNSINIAPLITASGNQQIVGEAVVGATTKRDTISFYVAPPTNIFPLPAGVRDGINYESGDTSAILVLRAPSKSRVNVLGDFNNWTEQASYQMNKTPDGKFFWLRLTGLTPGTEYGYQYLVDGTIKIGDPYTQKVLDPNNDGFISSATYPGLKPYPTGKTSGIVSVLQTNEPGYSWQVNNFTRPDKRSIVMYELLVRDFVEAHDWKTLKDTLSYLKTLGINAIHVMPFNEFEGNLSWGYNPNYYFAPDKYYGPKNTLKAFIDECHKNGIAVIMDMVLNHSFGTSPMVQLYFDGGLNRPASNNPWFNPVAKHAFNVGYDMNHESADTKYFFNRVTEFWLKEYKLDGFRFDLSKGFTQTQTCDGNGDNCNVTNWSNYDASRVAIWKRYYDSLQVYGPGSYVILEHFAANNEEAELSDYGMMLWGNLNYNFNEATMGYTSTSNFEGALHTARGWSKPHLIAYMESHDEERLMYKNINFGNSAGSYSTKNLNTGLRRNEMAAAYLFMMPGPKLIWQFGELGYDYSINTCPNGTVNNSCRTDNKPIKWDYKQVTERKRLYEVYAALLKLRQHPLFKDAFTGNRVDRSLSGGFKWLKVTTDTSNILVVGNFDVNNTTGTVTFQNSGTWYDYLTGETVTATGSAQSIFLQAGEYHVYVNRNVTNVITTPVTDIIYAAGKIRLSTYPNPVINTNAVIEYEIPENGAVSLSISNLAGQQVGAVQYGFKLKGVYKENLSTLPKNKLASGIYLLHLRFANKTLTQKLVITN